jgi:hypothetical protein
MYRLPPWRSMTPRKPDVHASERTASSSASRRPYRRAYTRQKPGSNQKDSDLTDSGHEHAVEIEPRLRRVSPKNRNIRRSREFC